MVGSMKLLCLGVVVFIILSFFLIEPVICYDNTEYDFSIAPPSGWQVQEEPSEMIAVMFIEQSSLASVNVVIQDGVEISIEEWTDADTDYYESYLSSNFDNYNLLFSGQRYVNQMPAHEFVYTASVEGVDVKGKQIMLSENDRLYVITCTALLTDFTIKVATFEECIQSFRILSFAAPSPKVEVGDLNLVLIITLVVVMVVIVISMVLLLKRKNKNVSNVNYSINADASSIQTQTSHNQSSVNIEAKNEDTPNFCRYCGKETKIGTVFCEKCGKRLVD